MKSTYCEYEEYLNERLTVETKQIMEKLKNDIFINQVRNDGQELINFIHENIHMFSKLDDFNKIYVSELLAGKRKCTQFYFLLNDCIDSFNKNNQRRLYNGQK